MPQVQSRIPDASEWIELQVHREYGGYWMVRYRYTAGTFARRSDWNDVEHLTDGEMEDVVAAVIAGWTNDVAPLF